MEGYQLSSLLPRQESDVVYLWDSHTPRRSGSPDPDDPRWYGMDDDFVLDVSHQMGSLKVLLLSQDRFYWVDIQRLTLIMR